MGFNHTQVDLFYILLHTELQDHKFTAGTIFIMDESGLSTVPNRLPKVVSARGKLGVNKIVSGERGQTITVVCCFSASGVYVPPAFVFPRNTDVTAKVFRTAYECAKSHLSCTEHSRC